MKKKKSKALMYLRFKILIKEGERGENIQKYSIG